MSEMPNDREDAQEEGISDSTWLLIMDAEVRRRADLWAYIKWASIGIVVTLLSLIPTGLSLFLAIAGVAFVPGVLFGIYRDRAEARDLSDLVLREVEPSGERASSNDGVANE